jgi:hypothetical protein
MSTVSPNASVGQSVAGSDGGAANLSSILNAVGKWGTALTATVQGKPVAASASGVAIGAKGSTSLTGGALSGNTLILILLIVGALIFVAMRK